MRALREPIGGLPGRRPGPLGGSLYPYQPQQAWLQGSVLIVEFSQVTAECDLLTAAKLRIRHRPLFPRGWYFSVLFASQHERSQPARRVLKGTRLVPADRR